MDVVENQNFMNERVSVDGKAFTACSFTNATLVYAAGGVPSFTNCTFQRTNLIFEDAASNTVQFLSGLYQGGFARSVDAIFASMSDEA